MKRIALAALLLLAALASGQWLEGKLPLLDTFGLPGDWQSLAYNNRNHTVYLSGDKSDSILVIDAERAKSIARVAAGGGVQAMCYNSVENKLYCAYSEADTVVVLDGTTHQILAKVGVGNSAGTFCYDSIDNKVYVGNWGSASVSVIDCRTDSVVATVECGGSAEATDGMCFVAAHKTVYCAGWGDTILVAIDCSADTILARIPVGGDPLAVCCNSTNDRVYCACWDGAVYGIDAASNDVVSVVPGQYCALTMACDLARNVLFVPSDDRLAVVDCSADSIVAEVELPEDGAEFVGYDPADDKIYVAQGEGGG